MQASIRSALNILHTIGLRALIALGPAACLLGVTSAMAQTYPSKPVRLVIPFAPGGASDITARAIQEALGRALGQTLILENKPGAGSSLGVAEVARVTPDGYTFLIASQSGIIVNPIINANVGYVVERDLIPVTQLTRAPLVVAVHPSLPVRSMGELIAVAKKTAGKLNYATSGNGSVPHLATVIFSGLTGVDMVHVPYKSGGLAVTSVVANDTHLTFATSPSVMPMVTAGKLRGIAVTTKDRSPLVPDLPGMAESKVAGFDLSIWYGFFLPARTPQPVVARLFEASSKAIADAKFKSIMGRDGTETVGSRTPAEFAQLIREEASLTAKAIKESGAKFE